MNYMDLDSCTLETINTSEALKVTEEVLTTFNKFIQDIKQEPKAKRDRVKALILALGEEVENW